MHTRPLIQNRHCLKRNLALIRAYKALNPGMEMIPVLAQRLASGMKDARGHPLGLFAGAGLTHFKLSKRIQKKSKELGSGPHTTLRRKDPLKKRLVSESGLFANTLREFFCGDRNRQNPKKSLEMIFRTWDFSRVP